MYVCMYVCITTYTGLAATEGDGGIVTLMCSQIEGDLSILARGPTDRHTEREIRNMKAIFREKQYMYTA